MDNVRQDLRVIHSASAPSPHLGSQQARPSWPLDDRLISIDQLITPPKQLPARAPTVRSTHSAAVAALVLAVATVDQAMKWWAWRHLATVRINPGGDAFVGTRIDGWFRGTWSGALLDLLDCALLAVVGWAFLQHARRRLTIVAGATLLGGWATDLLDRLGAHSWSAPGSIRGGVDFIPIGNHYFNVGDLFIVAAAPVLLGCAILARHRMLRSGAAQLPRPGRPSLSVVAGWLVAVPWCGYAVWVGATRPGWSSIPGWVINRGPT